MAKLRVVEQRSSDPSSPTPLRVVASWDIGGQKSSPRPTAISRKGGFRLFLDPAENVSSKDWHSIKEAVQRIMDSRQPAAERRS